VVVAAAGNKVASTSSEDFEGTPGNDAPVYPADYDGVLAVSATPPDNQDPAGYVLPNLDTDVAAPTAGAISVNATGGRCVIGEVATSWAAAEVSGLVALLRERFPSETARQIVARLQATTEGAGPSTGKDDVENPWTGAGVVQAHDALTRQLSIGRDGTVRTTVRETRSDAQAPPAPEKVDLFGSSRALLLWFGLLGGALLALVFLLRPLLHRR
jgi:membrane-anchored mycosin MYCP